jgi:hypothetical protein
VHTGTTDPCRSPHAWFDDPQCPSSIRGERKAWYRRLEEIYAMLRGFGCDGQMLKPSALTARLPGVPRLGKDNEHTGLWQRLLYLNPKFDVVL